MHPHQDEEYDLPPLAKDINMPVVLKHEPEDVTDVDAVLRFTQMQRMDVIRSVKKQADALGDPKLLTVQLKALSDMDKGVATKRRLGIEEEAQKTNEEQSRNVTDLLRGIKTTMFQSVPGEHAPRATPSLAGEVKLPTLVPGETDQGTASLTYDTFIKGLPAHEESASS